MTEYGEFLKKFKIWGEKTPFIESIIIVGSYAHGTNNKSSDVDLCIITKDKTELVENQEFINVFGTVEKKQTEIYGACTSIRVWYLNGLEVEFGIVLPSWIVSPLDVGTQGVLKDGYRVLFDREKHFQDLHL